MKLTVKRDQKDMKGMLGGHKGVKFILSAKAQLSEQERALIARYKVEDYQLAAYQIKNTPFLVSVNGLARGIEAETESITTLLELEDTIKQGCENLKTLLAVMATFGGEETIEI